MLSALFITGCVNDGFEEIAVQEKNQQEVVDSFYVSYETALKYARNVLADTMQTRVAARSVANHYEYVANKITRSANDDVEVRFHVINFDDNQGFALVSADSRTTPVYAYSETGNIDIDNAIENSGFADFMDAAIEYYIMETGLEDSIGGQLLPKDPTLPLTPVPTNPIQLLPTVQIDGVNYYSESSTMIIKNAGGVLLNVEWDQCFPYSYYCGENSNGYNAAGCGPIAAAQIMSYFKYPLSYGGYTFDWEGITSTTSFSYLSNAAMSAARLINLIGISAGANYGVETMTKINDMDDMFRSFGYSCSGPEDYEVSKIKESLNSYSPIYFRASEPGADAGHAWVIDAYKQTIINSTYYHSYEPFDVYITTTSYGEMYYHCNWGWGGTYNAWCLDVFKISNVCELSKNRRMIYNIKPNN